MRGFGRMYSMSNLKKYNLLKKRASKNEQLTSGAIKA
jgi:hypothetical protein